MINRVMETSDNYPKFITLAEAARHPMLPSRPGGKAYHTETIRRWALYGRRGRKLKSAMVGGIRCTTVNWLYEFITSETPENRSTPYPRTHRQRRAIRAEREARKVLGLAPKNGGAG